MVLTFLWARQVTPLHFDPEAILSFQVKQREGRKVGGAAAAVYLSLKE